MGIALKIADGDLTGRAGSCVMYEVLRQMGVLSPEELAELAEFGPRPIENWREIKVGDLRPKVLIHLKWQTGIHSLELG
jgi:L-asparaginase II